jgi:hypothetical protein
VQLVSVSIVAVDEGRDMVEGFWGVLSVTLAVHLLAMLNFSKGFDLT